MVRMMMPAEPGGDSGHDKKGRQISVMFQYNPKRCFDEQIRSVAQSCPTLCDPKNCSMPGLPVHHQLPEFAETHDEQSGGQR